LGRQFRPYRWHLNGYQEWGIFWEILPLLSCDRTLVLLQLFLDDTNQQADPMTLLTDIPTTAPDAGSVVSALLMSARATFASSGVSSLSSAGVAAAMKDLAALRGAASAFEASLRKRAQELQPVPEPSPLPDAVPLDTSQPPVPDEGPLADVSPPMLDHFSGLSSKEGRARDRHARVLTQMPALAKALAAGRIADGHVGVLAEILFSATNEVWAGLVHEQADLARVASQMNPIPFKRHVNQATHRIAATANASITRDLVAEINASLWIDRDTGLGRLNATFDPMAYAEISKILARLAGQISYNQRTMSRKEANGRALIQILTGTNARSNSSRGLNGSTSPPQPSGSSGAPGSCVGPGVTMSVIIDQRTLVHGAHADTICEHADGSRIPVNIAQQLACNATLIPILTDNGVVLNMGRGTRYASTHQRRALEAMYATCAITACETPVTECHDHHISYWEQGGRTDIANLVPVCQHHHRWIHANNPKVILDQQRTLTISMANGTTTCHHPDRHTQRPGHRHQHRQRSGFPESDDDSAG
jgi:hypothetical protein